MDSASKPGRDEAKGPAWPTRHSMTTPAEPAALRRLSRFLATKGRKKTVGAGWAKAGQLGFNWWFDSVAGRWQVGATPKDFAIQWYDADLWRAWLEDRKPPVLVRSLRQQARFFVNHLSQLERRLAAVGRDEAIAGVERQLAKRRFGWPQEVADLLDDCMKKGFDITKRSTSDPLKDDYYPSMRLAGGDLDGWETGVRLKKGRFVLSVFGHWRDHSVTASPVWGAKPEAEGFDAELWRAWLDGTPIPTPGPLDLDRKPSFDPSGWARAWRDDAVFFRARLSEMSQKVGEVGQEQSWKQLSALQAGRSETARRLISEAEAKRAEKKAGSDGGRLES
ncbi:MAG: hypothetical protein ABR562_02395 [Thermoplasmatota archaeon]